MKRLGILLRCMRPYRWHIALSLLLTLCSSATLLLFPYLAGKLVDVAQGTPAFGYTSISVITGFMLGVAVLQGIFSYGRIAVLGYAGEHVVAALRQALYGHLLRLPIAFHHQSRSGDLISRLSADSTLLYQGLTTQLVEWLRQSIIICIGVASLFSIAPLLGLSLLASFPVLLLVGRLLGKLVRSYSRDRQTKQGTADSMAQETLQLVETLKTFSAEEQETKRYAGVQRHFIKAALRGTAYRALMVAILIVVVLSGLTAVMSYGAVLVEATMMSTGRLFSFVLYSVIVGGAITGLGDAYSQWQKVAGALDRLNQIFEEPTENQVLSGKDVSTLSGDIRLEGVVFRYPTREEVPVLQGIDLRIKEGSRVALVGASGMGKSTIAALLMRYYDPNAGDLYWGDHALRTVSVESLRRHISFVPQDPLLLPDSIAQNLRYGRPDATEAELRVAAEKAQALAFIEQLPQGFDTPVGEHGVALSGGQRQRVAIARAILKDAPLLILDEATSALDSTVEKHIQTGLNAFGGDGERTSQSKTIITITHRLATIQQADCIYLIDQGTIQAAGTHEALLTQNDLYKNLIKYQKIK